MNFGQAARPKQRVAVVLLLLAAAMFGFGYALIPMYDAICAVTGINGKTPNVADAEVVYAVDAGRTVSVETVMSLHGDADLTFTVSEPKVSLHPGEYRTLAVQAVNRSNRDRSFSTMPSVSPGIAAAFFKKTQCFCFSGQTLKAGESKDLQLRFAIDPALPARYQVMTLSMSIFDITDKTVTQNSK